MKFIDDCSMFWIHQLLDLDTEACGILESVDEERFHLILDAIGESDKAGRKLCRFPRYSTYIWHTHPKFSKGYPSAEDIAKTLKPRERADLIYDQLIFTDWGIWEMYAGNKKQLVPQTVAAIAADANALWNVTEGGSVLTRSNISALESYTYALEYNLASYGFRIIFTPWWKLGSKKNYFLKIK